MNSGRPLAMVTGAGGGIGAGVSRLLMQRGFDVIAVDVSQEAVERVTSDLGSTCIGVVSDLSNRTDVNDLCDKIVGDWADRLHVIVCNAGIIIPADVVQTERPALHSQIDIMLGAPIQLIAAAAQVMASRGRGKILATVSMGAVLSLPGSAVYSAAKAGLRSFLAALSAELRGTGVSVTGVYPSGVDTPMLRHEAEHGGSMLNFVGKVFSVDDVVRAYGRALDGRRLEVFLPTTDSIGARLLAFSPQLGNRFIPMLEVLGRRGHGRYLKGIRAGDSG